VTPATVTRTTTGRFSAPPARTPARSELYALWTVAQAEANLAYDAWSASPGADAYAVFVAASDRADAALNALPAVPGTGPF
jgi:hypothetical protein